MKLDALKENLAAKYLAIAVLPLLVLLYTPLSNYVVLYFGEKILLETLPLDPRDILRGDYVRLEYKIQDIPNAMIPTELIDDYDYDRTPRSFYVSLVRDREGIASVLGASMRRPSNGTYLKARFRSSWSSRADYNLGVYYVPEGTGRALEEAIRKQRVLADVRVLRGRGVIKKLEVVDR